MPESYYDIRQQTTKPPQWFDSNGVPRYCRFHPDRGPAFMPDEVVLFEIGCQHCRKILRVDAHFSRAEDGSKGRRSLRTSVGARSACFPPRVILGLLLKRLVQYRPDVGLVPDALTGGEFLGALQIQLCHADRDCLGDRLD